MDPSMETHVLVHVQAIVFAHHEQLASGALVVQGDALGARGAQIDQVAQSSLSHSMVAQVL